MSNTAPEDGVRGAHSFVRRGDKGDARMRKLAFDAPNTVWCYGGRVHNRRGTFFYHVAIVEDAHPSARRDGHYIESVRYGAPRGDLAQGLVRTKHKDVTRNNLHRQHDDGAHDMHVGGLALFECLRTNYLIQYEPPIPRQSCMALSIITSRGQSKNDMKFFKHKICACQT